MKVSELLLLAMVGWCGIGLAGIVISLLRARRAEAFRHMAWLTSVAGVYLIVLLAVSVMQRKKVVAPGEDQCYHEMCFAVTGVDAIPSLVAGDDGRVVRVTIRVTNHARSAAAEASITAYLIDSRGRIWQPLAGLSGNRLNGRVAGGSQMLSQPMFRVAKDSAGLGLVFTHGNWQPKWLMIGNSDSLAHRPTVVALGR